MEGWKYKKYNIYWHPHSDCWHCYFPGARLDQEPPRGISHHRILHQCQPIRLRWLERHRYLRWIRLHDLRNHSYQLAFHRRTSTFHQYISVRKTKRQSGPSTVANHFDAWKKAGMNLGEHDYQVLSTEGYNNASGSRSQKIGTGLASYST
ncbi:concanavalin A-like lectin/glucanase domain-containing protein [Hyaloscypha finlandica]|nr:concanavalin A-like lectin/glucanase domain-containing protein [Hyaloscypha finlandica]